MFLAITLFGYSFSGREAAVVGVAALIVLVVAVFAWSRLRRR